MQTFLIVLAVLVVVLVLVLSVRATFYVSYHGVWRTRVRILFFEKEISLSQLLQLVLFPKQSGEAAAKAAKEKKSAKKEQTAAPQPAQTDGAPEKSKTPAESAAPQAGDTPAKPKKQNYLQSIYAEDGICGILDLVSTLLSTAGAAVGRLFKDFYISDLYVKIITGGTDAAQIAQNHGRTCALYYPLIGVVRNGMKVANYQEIIFADYLAQQTETEMSLVISLSVKNLFGILFSAGKTFLVNFIKNK